MSDAHEAWVDRCARWEQLYNEERNKLVSMERLYQAAEADLEADVAERDTQIAALKAALEAARIVVAAYDDNTPDGAWEFSNTIEELAAALAAVGIPEERRDG